MSVLRTTVITSEAPGVENVLALKKDQGTAQGTPLEGHTVHQHIKDPYALGWKSFKFLPAVLNI